MSSSDRILATRVPRRITIRIILAGVVAGSLAGCIKPLYGDFGAGVSVKTTLAAIDVAPIPERLGHYLRQELVFDLDGSGQPSPKLYRLTVQPRVSLTTAIVDTTTGRADSAALQASAAYLLVTLADGKTVAEGTATSSASYDRSPQRFATVRAARDAEIRLAKLLAEQIRTRIAILLSTR